jgi:diadenosine tetraphosphate (Ap4A) HIT family hydrolase
VPCAFCERITSGNLLASNELAVVFLDGYPVTPGHSLIIPRRHEANFLALTAAEQAAVWGLVDVVTRQLDAADAPDGYNIGVNVGEAAGQTIAHAHLHVILRRRGDVPDPRGGVRWVVPDRAAYWEGR